MERAFLFIVAILMMVRVAVAEMPRVTELPPDNIVKHCHWCQMSMSRKAQIVRFEAFWQKYHPENEEYGDVIEARFVRLGAYRLVALYVANGQTDRALKMLG